MIGLLFSGMVLAKNSYLNSVNSTCSVSYDCDLCHIDPGDGGPLNSDGQAFAALDNDPTYFCPGTACTDNDGDGDGDNKVNCADKKDCRTDTACNGGGGGPGGDPEICNDGSDNDGDGKIDCADKKDCRIDLLGPLLERAFFISINAHRDVALGGSLTGRDY